MPFTNNNMTPTSDSLSKTISNERPAEDIAKNIENYSKEQVATKEKSQEEDIKNNKEKNKNDSDLIVNEATKIKVQPKLKIQLRNSPMFKPKEERELMSDPKRQSKSPLRNYMNSTMASLKNAINKSSSNRNLSENKLAYNTDDENHKSKIRNSSSNILSFFITSIIGSETNAKNNNYKKKFNSKNRPKKASKDINEILKIDKKIFNFKNKVYKPSSPDKKGLRNEKHQVRR